MRHLLSAIVVTIAVACVAYSDESRDPIDRKLADAKAQYTKTTDAAREELIAQIDKAISAAQSAGDLKTLDIITSQKNAFVDSGTLPSKVATKLYIAALDNSRSKMATAFANAVKEYTRAGLLESARTTQKELDEFSKSSTKRPQDSPKVKPTFPVGQWVSLFPKSEQLASFKMDNTNYKYKQGILELQDCTAELPIDARNVAVRVTAKKLSGHNLNITLRVAEKGQYCFFFSGGNSFGLGKNTKSGEWQGLKSANTRDSFDDFVTLTFVAAGPELRAFVNSELVFAFRDEELEQGKIAINAYKGVSQFRDLSVQVLKGNINLNENLK